MCAWVVYEPPLLPSPPAPMPPHPNRDVTDAGTGSAGRTGRWTPRGVPGAVAAGCARRGLGAASSSLPLPFAAVGDARPPPRELVAVAAPAGPGWNMASDGDPWLAGVNRSAASSSSVGAISCNAPARALENQPDMPQNEQKYDAAYSVYSHMESVPLRLYAR